EIDERRMRTVALPYTGDPVAALHEHFPDVATVSKRREPLEQGEGRRWLASRRVELDDARVALRDAGLHLEQVSDGHGHDRQPAEARCKRDPTGDAELNILFDRADA